jgi:hypothetical protein
MIYNLYTLEMQCLCPIVEILYTIRGSFRSSIKMPFRSRVCWPNMMVLERLLIWALISAWEMSPSRRPLLGRWSLEPEGIANFWREEAILVYYGVKAVALL